MNEQARQKLLEIFARHGRSVIENPRRLEGLLRDYAAAHRREISVLLAAIEEHAVADLLAARSKTVPRKVLIARLAQRLCDNLGLTAEAARWSIESWALALGLISDEEAANDKIAIATRGESAPETHESGIQSAAIFAPSNAARGATATAANVRSKRTSGSLIVASDGAGHFASIAEAVRAAPPGSIITVREGLYDESVVLDKSVRIVGDGNPQNIVIQSARSSPLLMRTARASVSGVTIAARGGAIGKSFFAVEISRGELVLENCGVTSDSLSGVAVFGTGAAPLIKNCRIYDCADSGIYIFDNARPIIENCDVYRNGNVGVAIARGAAPTIKNCRIFEGNNGGIVVWGSGTAGLIENCRIYAHRLANVAVREDAAPVFRGCEIYDGRDTGIYIHQNGGGVFEDCRIYRNAKAEVGVSRNGGSVLRGCLISGGENSGIVMQDRGRLSVERCDIYENADAGVALFGASEIALRGCRIIRNGTVAVRILESSAALVEDCDLRGNRLATWETEHGISVERRNNIED